jgi:uncharacterized protein (TIGR02600 family)
MTLAHRVLTSPAKRAVMIQAGDISRTVEAATDLRVIASLSTVPASMFHAIPNYTLAAPIAGLGSHAHNIRFADGTSAFFAPGLPKSGVYPNQNATADPVYGIAYPATTSATTITDWHSNATVSYIQFTQASCSVPTGTNGVTIGTSSLLGDWDTGPGFAADGAQINLPDAGTALAPNTAYQSLSGSQPGAATQRTPNALVPSPVIFGSLPSGVNPADSTSTSSAFSSSAWQTLLFCPYPASNISGGPYTSHPGAPSATTPPDYLILDNFWMPVVEPYAISTCMTTAGKVNLNDQIVPFTYIHRSTALRALLDDLRIPAIPMAVVDSYKSTGTPIDTTKTPIWNPVDENLTVAQIENKFAAGSVDAYLSECEICAVPLVPLLPANPISGNVASVQSQLQSFWNPWTNPPPQDGGLTGDNLRELPYAQLYGRLTTRSNSYTVHVRAQVLKKLTSDPNQNVWNEGTDLVLGDWRGSYEIERYLDPTAPAPAAGTPLGPYKFRIISSHAFVP